MKYFLTTLLLFVNIIRIFPLNIIDLLEYYNEAKKILYDKTFFLEEEYYVVDFFGFQRDPFTDEITFVDYLFISTRNTTKILSFTDGEIVDIGYNLEMGNYVKIAYNEFEIEYGNLINIEINIGEKLSRGKLIGYCRIDNGRAGSTSGIRLRIKYKNVFLNPNLILNFDDNRIRY